MGFWRTKTLTEMTQEEWESLCDGCGRCCLHKLRDEDTEELSFTNVACRLLDLKTSRCSDYAQRRTQNPRLRATDAEKTERRRLAAAELRLSPGA